MILISIQYLRLKKDIKRLNRTLVTIGSTETNMRLTTQTFDKDITQLADSVNRVLNQQQSIVIDGRRMNREFRQGITNVSHDLRTPLTSSIGYVQMLKSGNVPEDKRQAYLTTIESRLKSLRDLINELFYYTKVVEGKADFHYEEVDIAVVLQNTALSFYDDFVQKGFEVNINLPESPFKAIVDAPSIERVFQNLIKNVLAHGEQYFELSTQPTEKKIMFRNKISHPEHLDLERLFDRFYTTDSSRSSKRTGLGMAITKELMLQMGGEIEAEITGSIFSVILTLA
jgi:signal transduction histidine kinase